MPPVTPRYRIAGPAILFCLMLSLFLPAVSPAGQTIDRIRRNGVLVLGTPGDFPPFSVTTAQGELIGFDIALARELARTMGVNLRISRLPFAELVPRLQQREVDIIMSGISITPKRNMDIAFIGPYGNSGQAFIGKNEVVSQLTQPLDLNRADLAIAVLHETTAEMTVKAVLPKVRMVASESLDEALIMLLKGTVDGIIADYPYCKVAEFRYKDQGLAVFDKILTFEQLGIGVLEEDGLFINLLRNYLNLLAGSGALQRMQEIWFKNSGWVEELPDLNVFKDF